MNTTAMDILKFRGIDTDLPMMDAYIDATHPDLIRRMPFAEYLMNWNEAKERGELFKLFGGKTIISKKIKFSKSYEEIVSEDDTYINLDRLTEDVANNIIVISQDILEDVFEFSSSTSYRIIRFYGDHYHPMFNRNLPIQERQFYFNREVISLLLGQNSELHDFFDIVSILYEITRNFYTWYSNSANWSHDGQDTLKHPCLCMPNYDKKFRLTLGQKPVRALNGFINYLQRWIDNCDAYKVDKDSYLETLSQFEANVEALRLYASMMNNQNSLEGILSISIHPFDYMTMSDPDNGWTSCMRWNEEDQGEYHAGTLEMMTSPCVVVAYLESKDKIAPGGIYYQWNKKNWRELFIVDKNFISGIKGYPYNNDKLEDNVFSILNDLAKENWGVSYNLNIVTKDVRNSFYLNGKYYMFATNFMYNDRAFHTARVVVANGSDVKFNADIPAGGKTEYFAYGENCFCLQCGNIRDRSAENGQEGELLCFECRDYIRCSHCGEPIYRGDTIIIDENTVICEECAKELTECELCSNKCFGSDMYTMRIQCEDTGSYIRPSWYTHYTSITICAECFDNYLNKNFIEGIWFKKIDNYILQLLYNQDDAIKDGSIKIIAEWVGEGEKPACIK